mmetsp:Transcript_10079/g.61263  ORF Transcript_10079/g.61263 Transcript_10079/m.61263 type:complete len:102 (-) Transcript_10079:3638-3943(-)
MHPVKMISGLGGFGRHTSHVSLQLLFLQTGSAQNPFIDKRSLVNALQVCGTSKHSDVQVNTFEYLNTAESLLLGSALPQKLISTCVTRSSSSAGAASRAND